ncbi:MAG: LysR family transcriptional regulator [Clostridiales bacterium]|nr:LysR family transcriptional regulator [Clostridiales bacterium]
MDLKLMESILMIHEEKSITRASEKLFVTQSALSQQLQKLETELGTPLFTRTRSDWRPTPAGEVYIQAAKEILMIKRDAYNRIYDMAEQASRHFNIGLIPERGIDMFTAIYPQFHREWPEVILEPLECNVRTMQRLITKGQIDLGLITLTENQKDDNHYLSMGQEEIFLAVPSDHPLAPLGGPDAKTAPVISLGQFRDDSFVEIARTSTMHQLVEKLFQDAGFTPKILFRTSSNISKYRMVCAGVGCALLPAIFALPDKSITYFRLDQHPFWEITMCYRKNAYLSNAQKAFLRLCRQYWSNAAIW